MLKSTLTFSLLFAITLIGCGGVNTVQSVQAANIPALVGRYLFRAEMHVTGGKNFVEGGILTIDGNGGFTLIGTFNANVNQPGSNDTGITINSPNVSIMGSYTWDSSAFTALIPAVTGAPDAFSSPARFYCRHDSSYCTMVSAEVGRPWQGKMWHDTSDPSTLLSVSELQSRYIFESDSSFNFFVESGVITFDGAGKMTLESVYNATNGNLFSEPGRPWACGNYSANSNSGHITQFFCWDFTTPTDTMALYCFNDASRCVAVPDLTEAGSWIAEVQRQ